MRVILKPAMTMPSRDTTSNRFGAGFRPSIRSQAIPLIRKVLNRYTYVLNPAPLGFSWTPNCDENESKITRRWCMSKEKEPASGVPEGARRATGGTPEEAARWPRPVGRRKRKYAAMLRLMRGGRFWKHFSRELGGDRRNAVRLARAVSGGRRGPNLKAREAAVDNEETQRLKSLVADLSMSNETAARKRFIAWRPGRPFGLAEAEAMSRAASPFTKKNLRRGACHRRMGTGAFPVFYYQRGIAAQPDRVLQTARTQEPLGATRCCSRRSARCSPLSPFYGARGHRKVVGAACAFQEVRTSKARVLRLMREAQLLAPSRAPAEDREPAHRHHHHPPARA